MSIFWSMFIRSFYRMQAWSEIGAALRQGFPAVEAAERAAKHIGLFRSNLLKFAEALKSGNTVATAAGKSGGLFPGRWRRYLDEGEKAGAPVAAFTLMEQEYRRSLSRRRLLVGVLLYPLLVGAIIAFFTPLNLLYTTPVFAKMAADAGTVLGGHFNFVVYYLAILAVVVLVFAANWRLGHEAWFHRLVSRLPLFGPAGHDLLWGEFCRVLGGMVREGVGLPAALAAAAGVTGRRLVIEAAANAGRLVGEGVALSEALRRAEVFPPSVIFAAAQGERTGRLAEALDGLADRCERTGDAGAENSLRLVEYALLTVIAFGAALAVFGFFGDINSLGTMITR